MFIVIFDQFDALPIEAERFMLSDGSYYFFDDEDSAIGVFSENAVTGVSKAEHMDLSLFDNIREGLLMNQMPCGECPACLQEAQDAKKEKNKSKLDIN